MRLSLACSAVALAAALHLPSLAAQQQPPGPMARPAQKIREGVYRVGRIEIDTLKKELRVPATINSGVTTLEFVANTPAGHKAYESALTVHADAFEFNASLLLLGLDPARARVSVRHFDPIPPSGDPIDLFVDWIANGVPKRIRVEQLLYDERTKTTLVEGPWVYTGSTFMNGRYMSELDGVLIGFVHSPSPIIENPRSGAVSAYGSVVLNKSLGLAGGSAVTLVVKALPVKAKSRP